MDLVDDGIQNSFRNSDLSNEFPDPESIMRKVESEDADEKLHAVLIVKKALNGRQYDLVRRLVDCGLILALITCLQVHHSTLQVEAAKVLSHIVSKSSAHRREAIGAVPHLVDLLNSPDKDVRLQSFLALGELAGRRRNFCEQAMELGIVPALLSFIGSDAPVELLRLVSWGINFFSCTTRVLPAAIVTELIPRFCDLIDLGDAYICFQVLSALWNISNSGAEQSVLLMSHGRLLSCLTRLIDPDLSEIQTAAVKTLRRITTAHEPGMTPRINGDALCHLPELLQQPGTKDPGLLFLFLLRTTSEQQVQAVLDAGLYSDMISHLGSDEVHVQEQALRAVEVFASLGNAIQASCFVRQGVIPRLCDILDDDSDPEILQMVLRTVKCLLESAEGDRHVIRNQIETCSGLDRIIALQHHESVDVRTLVARVIALCTPD